MIQVIGVKRIIMLIIAFAVNAALASACYLYVFPQKDKVDRQLQSLQSETRSKQNDTARLQEDFAQIQEKKAYFETLEAAGFMSDQNRLVARRRIMDIQKYTRVLKARYEINSADVIKTRTTDNIGYVVLSSPINVDIDALDDIDLYNFVYWMQNAFPGHLVVKEFHMTRAGDIGEASLRQIGSGQPLTLVTGKAVMEWRTIMPEADAKAFEETPSEGF